MSQADLAAVSGLAQPNISAIENGRRAPSAETLRRLLASCGVALVAHGADGATAIPAPVDARAVLDPEPPTVTRDTPMAHRVRVITAVLDAAEAIVRAR